MEHAHYGPSQVPGRRRFLTQGAAAGAMCLLSQGARAEAVMPRGLRFPSIDGGELSLDKWAGRPILVVNTASRCGFTGQYDGLQALYDRYREQGLIVLAVPSDDFRQELSSAEAVKEFCEINFGLDLPMTDITHVRGRKAHPLFAWLREAHGYRPKWNFHKALISGEGRFIAGWASQVQPTAPAIVTAIEAVLPAA